MPSDLRRRSDRAARCFKASIFAVPLAVGAVLLLASPARADSDEGFDTKGDDAIAADKNAREEKGDKMPGEKEKAKETPAPDVVDPKYDPLEEQGTRYNFVGLRFRDAIVPKFMVNIFASGGATVNAPMFGPEFTTRKGRFEVVFASVYADYSKAPFMAKGSSDGDEAYEIVSSKLKMILFTSEFLYNFPIDKTGKLTFLFGGGVGFGVVFDNLYRNQAYPAYAGAKNDPSDANKWKPCTGVMQPPDKTAPGASYCDDANKHYGNYTEPSWANGGSKPNIFPWLAFPQFGLRYKPIKQLQTRFDLGFSTSGFFFGLSAGYGL